MRGKNLALFIALLVAILSGTGLAYAQEVGVGVNLGKISVDKPMMPGGSYQLPPISIINTGQVAGDYEMAVSYRHEQAELQPPGEWFEFTPKTVTLEPGKSQPVAITLKVPMRAKPGDYFAYLEAHPVAKAGGIAIGIAAATKLYFTVTTANYFYALANQASAFFEDYAPYSWVGLAAIILIILVLLFRRFAHISLRVEKKG